MENKEESSFFVVVTGIGDELKIKEWPYLYSQICSSLPEEMNIIWSLFDPYLENWTKIYGDISDIHEKLTFRLFPRYFQLMDLL